MADRAQFLVIDNDALVLLAGTGLLGDILQSLGLEEGDFRYNGTFPFYFRKKLRSKLPEHMAQRVDAAILAGRPLDLSATEERLARLQPVDGIDAGEAVLFGVVAEHPALLLTTNDKRALKTLATDERATDTRRAIAGRVLSMEHVCTRLMNELEPSSVILRCREGAQIDKMIAVVFSDHNAQNPAECRAALNSYRTAVETACGADLFLSGP